LGWAVLGDEPGEAVNGVVGGGDREQLAGVPMSPDVAKVEVGGYEGAFFREPQDVAGVQMEGGG